MYINQFSVVVFKRQHYVFHILPATLLSVIFQSCNFHPLKFLCPSFSCPANSASPYPSVRLSVRRTGGSVKKRLKLQDHAVFTAEYRPRPIPLVLLRDKFYREFWRVPLSGASNKGRCWGKTSYFLALGMRQYLKTSTRYDWKERLESYC